VEYAAFMDGIIRSTPPAAAADPLAQWNEVVRSEANWNESAGA
jgi:hypothetical protein